MDQQNNEHDYGLNEWAMSNEPVSNNRAWNSKITVWIQSPNGIEGAADMEQQNNEQSIK